MQLESLGEMASDGSTAKEIHNGLAPKHRKAVPAPAPAEVTAFVDKWSGQSVWKLWAVGPLERYHVLHWALHASHQKVGALARYLLRVESMHDAGDTAAANVVAKGLAADAGTEVADAALAALPILFDAVHSASYTDGFDAALAPLLAAVPEAEVTCGGAILADDGWSRELVRYCAAATRSVDESDFTGHRMLGVGGFGMVMVGFKKDTGRAYALKRQNISMVIDKSMVEVRRARGRRVPVCRARAETCRAPRCLAGGANRAQGRVRAPFPLHPRCGACLP